ncbi:MAG: nucleoside triphosphate pyrophosphohydrolase [Anaerolineaceae bacterium]|nr:nucleoside triphosphate pyrophosphohydrolase [Anaerolineaceae bacterium]
MNEQTFTRGVTIVGLGPGDENLLTCQARDWLVSADEIFLRTRFHPAAAFLSGKQVFSFDEVYETEETFEAVYEKIICRVLELGERPEGVTYAVPGHPYVAETTSPEIVRRARKAGIPVRVIDGMSFLEPTFVMLELDPFPRCALLDALELGIQHHPFFPPDMPALIAQIYSREVAANVKLTLMAVYPDDYPVKLIHAAGTSQAMLEALPLYEIDRSPYIGLLSSLYLPPMEKESSFESFQELIAHLRAPEGCPWDREQTHESLRSALLEETYEVISALDSRDVESLQEELGDLLLQIVLHAQIAAEEGEFGMADVLRGIHSKLVYRHPHVFGSEKMDNSDHVVVNWEKLKAEKRKEKGGKGQKGLLDGVPPLLPALAQAQSFQARAARVGFDWSEFAPVLEKVHEELAEVLAAESDAQREMELGDLIFAVVNLVRWYKVDAESALRTTNRRFARRFAHVEKRARESGRLLDEMTLSEMDVFWDEAKKIESGED